MLHLALHDDPAIKITSHPTDGEVRISVHVAGAYHELTFTPERAEQIGDGLRQAALYALTSRPDTVALIGERLQAAARWAFTHHPDHS